MGGPHASFDTRCLNGKGELRLLSHCDTVIAVVVLLFGGHGSHGGTVRFGVWRCAFLSQRSIDGALSLSRYVDGMEGMQARRCWGVVSLSLVVYAN